jgi:hypothetical protein
MTQPKSKEEIINQFIVSVCNYDTIKLFSTVDTNEYYKIQNKEYLFSQIKWLKKKFISCEAGVIENYKQMLHRDIPFTDYTYFFCREKIEIPNEKSFDVKFAFADFDANNKIRYFEIRDYAKKESHVIPVPASNNTNSD